MNDISYNSKPLTVIAVIVFIYSVAGGSFNGTLSLLGATLVFSKPVLIEYMAVLAIIFLLWRHVVFTWPALKGCRQEFLDGTDLHHLNSYFENKVSGKLHDKDLKASLVSVDNISIRLNAAGISYFIVVASYYLDGVSHSEEFVIKFFKDFRLNLYVQKQFSKSLLRTIFIKPNFWEIYYPIILSTLAVTFYLQNYIKR
ncbi:hypothetical protein ACSZNL_01170 [Aeromonas jandaei]